MSGDLLTDAQLQSIRWRHMDGEPGGATDSIRDTGLFAGWEMVARWRHADRAALLAHIAALQQKADRLREIAVRSTSPHRDGGVR